MKGFHYYSTKEFSRILKDNGFVFERQRGTHFIWKRGPNETVVINKDVNAMICKRYIKTFNLKVQ